MWKSSCRDSDENADTDRWGADTLGMHGKAFFVRKNCGIVMYCTRLQIGDVWEKRTKWTKYSTTKYSPRSDLIRHGRYIGIEAGTRKSQRAIHPSASRPYRPLV